MKANIAIETSGVGAMVEYASIGLGTTIATTAIVGAMASQVAMVPIEDAPTFKLCLTWNSRKRRSPVAERFLALARLMLVAAAGRPSAELGIIRVCDPTESCRGLPQSVVGDGATSFASAQSGLAWS